MYRLITRRRHDRPRATPERDWTLCACYVVAWLGLAILAAMAHSHVSGGL